MEDRYLGLHPSHGSTQPGLKNVNQAVNKEHQNSNENPETHRLPIPVLIINLISTPSMMSLSIGNPSGFEPWIA